MNWNLIKNNKVDIENYNKVAGTDELMSTILMNRKIDKHDAKLLMESPHKLLLNPYDLTNAEEASNEILKHIEKDSEIHVFADYDVDGITSGYSMVKGIESIADNEVYPYYPERSEGFGINMDYVEAVLKRKESIDKEILVITVDNGTTRVEEINRLIENGIDVIVTDHHKAGQILPRTIVVNPHANNDEDFLNLSGCGVVFQILYILYSKLNASHIEHFLPPSALGTIADVMPLDKNNIALCMMGLNKINNGEIPKGLNMFIDNIGIRRINSQDVSWEISPRLNACGRMENIDLAADLMFLNEYDDTSIIRDTILEIEETNQKRRKITKDLENKIKEVDFSNNNVCIYNDKDVAPGIAGILASRIAEDNNKPAIVLSENDKGTLTGSVRSVGNIDILKILSKQKDLGNLISVGGHAKAAGLELNKDMLVNLQKSIDEHLDGLPVEEQVGDKEITIDSTISLKDINNNNHNLINELPYDRDKFPYPVFKLEGVEIIGKRESSNNPDNVKIDLRDKEGNTKSFWAWRTNNKLKELGNPRYVDIVGSIKRNFMSINNSTFDVIDIKVAKEVEGNE